MTDDTVSAEKIRRAVERLADFHGGDLPDVDTDELLGEWAKPLAKLIEAAADMSLNGIQHTHSGDPCPCMHCRQYRALVQLVKAINGDGQ